MVSPLFSRDELRHRRCTFFPSRDENGGGRFSLARLAMIVAESLARSNLFLPARGISRAEAGYLFMVINHAKPGDAGFEKCPELKEARKRANIRSRTIRRARIMPWQNALFPFLYPEAPHYPFPLFQPLSLSLLAIVFSQSNKSRLLHFLTIHSREHHCIR